MQSTESLFSGSVMWIIINSVSTLVHLSRICFGENQSIVSGEETNYDQSLCFTPMNEEKLGSHSDNHILSTK